MHVVHPEGYTQCASLEMSRILLLLHVSQWPTKKTLLPEIQTIYSREPDVISCLRDAILLYSTRYCYDAQEKSHNTDHPGVVIGVQKKNVANASMNYGIFPVRYEPEGAYLV